MSDYLIEVAAGNAPSSAESIMVHGRNSVNGTTFEPVSLGAIYRTPQVGGATTLRVKAGNANDTANGSGARLVRVHGLDSNGVYQYEDLVTNGASAGTSGTISFIRAYRAEVITSGTYGSQAAGSHSANIVIENSAGTQNWITIDATDFPQGASEVGAYTIPKGKTGYVTSIHYTVDTTKTTSLVLFQRNNILQTAAPYSPIEVVWGVRGIATAGVHDFEIPLGPFYELTDLGLMSKVSSTTSSIDVYFEILLRDQE